MKLEEMQELKPVTPTIETMDDLHNMLKSGDVDFSRDEKKYYYIIEFVDNSVDSVLFASCYDTPILALRELPSLLEKTKSNVDNVAVYLRYAVPKTATGNKYVAFQNTILSPYLYFKKPSEEVSASAQVDN